MSQWLKSALQDGHSGVYSCDLNSRCHCGGGAESEEQRRASKSLEATLQKGGSAETEALRLEVLRPCGQGQGTGGNVAQTRHKITAKTNLEREGFIWLILPGHNLPLRQVRAGS